MTPLQELEQKIRQEIPFLKEEFEAFEDGSIDRDMITQVALNHVLVYLKVIINDLYVSMDTDGGIHFAGYFKCYWNLKSAYLKDQSPELINFLNGLK